MDREFENNICEWDDPNRAVDKLNRSEFAERVCRGVRKWSAPESLVIAVYGEWGSGKTWLLNKIESKFSNSDNLTICKFSPWQFENNEQIAAEFFEVVLDSLKPGVSKSRDAEERASLWRALGQIVTVGQLGAVGLSAMSERFSPAALALGAVGKLLDLGKQRAEEEAVHQGVEEIRAKLKTLFMAKDSPRILVAIDDLDRLEDRQIQMVLRLVKTNANFPNLNYLLLGERKQLAGALDPIANDQGDRYLEKIVHVPLTLPKANVFELQSRLWEGLEIIASECNYGLEHFRARFEHCWTEVFQGKLSNFRSVHRLLTIVSFHAKCLTREEMLEVDLLDLVAIDFIRIFSPALYQILSSDPPNEAWAVHHREISLPNDKEKKDAKAALDILKLSDLGYEKTFRLLSVFFPPVTKTLPNLTQEYRYNIYGDERHRLDVGQRPIWSDQFQSLYFQLSPQSTDLPLSRYKHFLSTTDPLELVKMLEKWGANGWRRQLIITLYRDDEFPHLVANRLGLLLAIASVSDEFDATRGEGENEMQSAVGVWFQLFRSFPESERICVIEQVLEWTSGVTIPLLIIEELRDKNGAAFSKGSRADDSIPLMKRKEIERFTDDFFPQIQKRFFSRKFPVERDQGYRLYRLAHAVGPERLEFILRRDPGYESGWAIAKGVIGSLISSGRLNLFKGDSVIPEVSKNVLNSLCHFSSQSFWDDFQREVRAGSELGSEELVILEHIALGIKTADEEFKDATQ